MVEEQRVPQALETGLGQGHGSCGAADVGRSYPREWLLDHGGDDDGAFVRAALVAGSGPESQPCPRGRRGVFISVFATRNVIGCHDTARDDGQQILCLEKPCTSLRLRKPKPTFSRNNERDWWSQ